MKRAIITHRQDFIAIVALVVVGLAVVTYILEHQPSFTFGKSYYTVRAEFASAPRSRPGRDSRSTSRGCRSGRSEGCSCRTATPS